MNSLFKHASFKLKNGRRLAFQEVGAKDSPRVLLCLPGLLETSASFDPMMLATAHAPGLRTIAIDHCGRGKSEALPNDSGYAMSVYLADVEEFIAREIFHSSDPQPKLDVLGTSMGGILAMYAVSNPLNHLNGLFLNDIGLSLTWMSIMGLYKSRKVSGRMLDEKEIALKLGVTEGAARDVQSTHHFDLPHQKDWKGMNFSQTLSHFAGPVRLIYGSQSGVCLEDQAQQFIKNYHEANVLKVEGESHPVPFTENVCDFILQALDLEPFSRNIEPPLLENSDQPSTLLSLPQVMTEIEPAMQEEATVLKELQQETPAPSNVVVNEPTKIWFKKIVGWFNR